MQASLGTSPSEPPLTTGQVAKRFNVHRTTVTKWVDEGLIPFFRTPSGQLRFHAAEIDARTEALSKSA
jgi:excisionase family DNA binding protein